MSTRYFASLILLIPFPKIREYVVPNFCPEDAMSRSARLGSQDWRAIIRLVGECRELGDDPHGWRRHFVGQLSRLTGKKQDDAGQLASHRWMYSFTV
jgi:hypothetical protein